MRGGIDVNAVLAVFILSSVVFALLYFPILTKLSRGLLSPYAKADVRKRLYAAAIDGLVVVTTWFLYWTSNSVLYLAAGAAYVLFRDAVKGQSIGKFLLGLVVISLETSRPSSLAGSLWRNVIFLLPGANVVAVFLEARTLVRDPQGQRLGDTLAQTQVVEGAGARDLVESFQDWLMGLDGELDRAIGKRNRAPVRTDRAA